MTGVKGQMGSTVHWDIFFASSALTISHDSGVVPKQERPVENISKNLFVEQSHLLTPSLRTSRARHCKIGPFFRQVLAVRRAA